MNTDLNSPLPPSPTTGGASASPPATTEAVASTSASVPRPVSSPPAAPRDLAGAVTHYSGGSGHTSETAPVSSVEFPASPPLPASRRAIPPLPATTVAARRELASRFKPGDVIFSRVVNAKGRDLVFVDKMIVMMQRMANWLRRSATREHTNISHCFVVVEVNPEKGQVLVAEAIPGSGLRTIDLLAHENYQLRQGSAYEYEVMRIDDRQQNIAQQAGRIANIMSERASYLREVPSAPREPHRAKQKKLKSQYSWSLGFRGLLGRGTQVNEAARVRLMRTLFDEANQSRIATTKSKPRSFTCSSFVSYVLQRAAIARHFQESLTVSFITSVSPQASGQSVERWAGEMTRNNAELNSMLNTALGDTLNIDAHHTKPYELRARLAANNLFRPLFTLAPPAQ